MSEARIVNGLTEYLANADGPKRKPFEVGQRLAYCQQRCPDWFRSCGRYELSEWITIMVTPGRGCRHLKGRTAIDTGNGAE